MDEDLHFLCWAEAGNVFFSAWSADKTTDDEPLLAVVAPPVVFWKVVRRMAEACMAAERQMPNAQMSPLELPMRSEVQ